ncbi:hypothetical protein [Kineothrix alysoides]|uniref:hypothetical protein n=1 Tax=Kineothrix alysoides TaxID=1469948 RepID=UPI0004DB7D3E|nr:hypothetical protein [Kineothrix alysoides]
MGSIEPLIGFAVAPFYLSIVPWRKKTDQLMPDAIAFQMDLKKGWFFQTGAKIGNLYLTKNIK